MRWRTMSMQEVGTAATLFGVSPSPSGLRCGALTCFLPAAWCRAWMPLQQGTLQAYGTVLAVRLGLARLLVDRNKVKAGTLCSVPLQAGSQGHMHCTPLGQRCVPRCIRLWQPCRLLIALTQWVITWLFLTAFMQRYYPGTLGTTGSAGFPQMRHALTASSYKAQMVAAMAADYSAAQKTSLRAGCNPLAFLTCRAARR